MEPRHEARLHIQITTEQREALDRIAEKSDRPLARVVRQAVDEFVERQQQSEREEQPA